LLRFDSRPAALCEHLDRNEPDVIVGTAGEKRRTVFLADEPPTGGVLTG